MAWEPLAPARANLLAALTAEGWERARERLRQRRNCLRAHLLVGEGGLFTPSSPRTGHLCVQNFSCEHPSVCISDLGQWYPQFLSRRGLVGTGCVVERGSRGALPKAVICQFCLIKSELSSKSSGLLMRIIWAPIPVLPRPQLGVATLSPYLPHAWIKGSTPGLRLGGRVEPCLW